MYETLTRMLRIQPRANSFWYDKANCFLGSKFVNSKIYIILALFYSAIPIVVICKNEPGILSHVAIAHTRKMELIFTQDHRTNK